MKSKDFHLEAV